MPLRLIRLLPAWMVAVILGRELSVTVLRSMIHARGQSLPASPLGKIKMAAQVTAILLLILAPHMREINVAGHVALWIATIAALVSAADYWRRFNAGLPVTPPSSAPTSRSPAATATGQHRASA